MFLFTEGFISFFNTDIGQMLTLLLAGALFIVLSGLYFKKVKLPTRTLTYIGLAIAIAFILSHLRLYRMPQGGSVTPLSMFFVTLPALWFGPAIGFIAGISYGLLRLVTDTYFVHPLQILLDYPVAFGMAGLAGFFYKMKGGLYVGFVIACVGRFVVHVASGVFFFAQYAPEGTHPLIHSIVFNASYIFAEMGITIVILAIPAVYNAYNHVKRSVSIEAGLPKN